MAVRKDRTLKEYNYLSRYASVPTYYNSVDKKRYCGTSFQLSRSLTNYSRYVVKQGDTLDMIALTYYNNPLYWWVIADINSIQDPLIIKEGLELKLPNINEVAFVDSLR